LTVHPFELRVDNWRTTKACIMDAQKDVGRLGLFAQTLGSVLRKVFETDYNPSSAGLLEALDKQEAGAQTLAVQSPNAGPNLTSRDPHSAQTSRAATDLIW
jgi:hypothetical protein